MRTTRWAKRESQSVRCYVAAQWWLNINILYWASTARKAQAAYRWRLIRRFALVALFGQSGAQAAHRPSNCSGPLLSCCLFKRVHLLLYAVIAFCLLFALQLQSRWTSRRGQLPYRRWVTDIQSSLAGCSLLLLSDRSQFDYNVQHSDEKHVSGIGLLYTRTGLVCCLVWTI